MNQDEATSLRDDVRELKTRLAGLLAAQTAEGPAPDHDRRLALLATNLRADDALLASMRGLVDGLTPHNLLKIRRQLLGLIDERQEARDVSRETQRELFEKRLRSPTAKDGG